MSCNHLSDCQRCGNYAENLEDHIAELEAKLAAAEADAVAQRDKVRVLRETLEQLLAYVETGYGDFGSDEGAQIALISAGFNALLKTLVLETEVSDD